jgi:hypothetical protein
MGDSDVRLSSLIPRRELCVFSGLNIPVCPDSRRVAMSKLKIKNGTPVGGEHLCARCSWSQCVTGYRDSDRMVICNKTNPNLVVPFVVLDCTGFDDRFRPDWQQMEKLAIDIQPVRVSAKTSGFSTLRGTSPVPAPAEDEDEAVVAR